MQDHTAPLSAIASELTKAQNVLIVTHEHPTFDSIGSALALSIALIGMGKKVTVACPDPMTVDLSSFVGVNKIVSEFAKKNFVISLDYVEGSIEKVSYNIEGDKFNLVVEPRPSFPPFIEKNVHFGYAGITADVIISIDTIHLGGLKKLYESDKELFASKPIINIDRHANNALYGQTNIVDSSVASTAELVGMVLTSLGAAMTQDIATNLLNALYGITNNFQSLSVTPGTFEFAAACVKAGGMKFRPVDTNEEKPKKEVINTTPEEAILTTPTEGFDPVSIPEHPKEAPLQPAPAEWLKPKIFKSSHLL